MSAKSILAVQIISLVLTALSFIEVAYVVKAGEAFRDT